MKLVDEYLAYKMLLSMIRTDSLTEFAHFSHRFIPQDSVPVDSVLMKSCPPVVPADQYIALDKALVYENDKDRHIFRHCVLCWSTQSTLPKWVQLSKELSEVILLKVINISFIFV